MTPNREAPVLPSRLASPLRSPPRRRDARLRLVGRARAVLWFVVVIAVAAVATGCGGPTADEAQEPDAANTPAELPELAAIGGVHDVWAFEFGMDSDREAVRAHLGEPAARIEGEDSGRAGAPRIVVWEYDGLEVTFLIDEANESERLLSVEISDPSVPTRGGLEVGMQLDRATELLGEPRVVNERSLVYFYRNTTIELIASGDVVEAIHLARALP